jgi:hypothetical protein
MRGSLNALAVALVASVSMLTACSGADEEQAYDGEIEEYCATPDIEDDICSARAEQVPEGSTELGQKKAALTSVSAASLTAASISRASVSAVSVRAISASPTSVSAASVSAASVSAASAR